MSQDPRVAQLVETIVQLELVPPEKYAALRALAQQCSEPMAFYRSLVQQGLLTPYQVNALASHRANQLRLGPYRILEPLGRGVISEVFKARHRALGRICALKVIDNQRVTSPDLLQWFFRQIQAATRLNHPNIAIVYDAGQDGDRCYYAMEYVEGKSVDRLVRERGPVPVPLACEYIRQAALALQHAADLGLVHGNLRPVNILVCRDPDTQVDRVKLVDFGLARLSLSGGTLAQSPGADPNNAAAFLAPETRYSPGLGDIRADIYSLGAVLYYLLTGRAPGPSGYTGQQAADHLRTQPVPITEIRRDLPPALPPVLEKMLAARPQERFSHPGEVAQALAPLAMGSLTVGTAPSTIPPPEAPPVIPIPEGLEPRAFRLRRRNYSYLVFGAVVSFLLGVALAVWLVFVKPSKPANLAARSQDDNVLSSEKPPTPPNPVDKPTEPKSEEPTNEPAVPKIAPGIPSLVLQAPVPTGKIQHLALDPYGEEVAILEELGQVNIYRASDGKLRTSFPIAQERSPLGIAWQGPHALAVVYQDGVEWREASRGHVRGETRLNLSAPPKTKLGIQPLAYSSYTDLLAFPWNKSLVLANSQTGRYLVQKNLPDEVLALAFVERSGPCLALTRHGLYKMEEQIERLEIPKPEVHSEVLPVGALSSDGRWAALVWRTGQGTKAEFSILAWTLSQPAQLTRIQTPVPPQRLVLVPATQQLAALYSGVLVAVYDLPRGEMSLVVRGSGRISGLACAALTPRVAICEETALYAVASLRDWGKPAAAAVEIVSEPVDPPAESVAALPMPAPGQEQPARLALQQKYAELYKQPNAIQQLRTRLLEDGRRSTDAAEILACALEIAAISAPRGDFTGLDLALGLLQDRLLAEPEELRRILLSEFSRQNVPLSALANLLSRWEQLADVYVSKLDLANAAQCLKQASELAQRDKKLSALKVPQWEYRITLYNRALEDKAKVQQALEALEKNPDDAQAHRMLGLFYIRRLEDYPRGFRHLSRCNDPTLVKLASRELVPPMKVDEMVQLAEDWVQAGQTVQPDAEARWYYERAVHWYRQAYSRQLQDNALLAGAIAERWKKAVARFPDLPGPHASGFVRQHPTGLTNLVALAACGDRIIAAGRVREESWLVVLDAVSLKETGRYKLAKSPRWLKGCGLDGSAVIGLIDGSMYWLQTNPAPVQVKQQTSVSEEARYLQGAFVAKTNRLVVISDQQLFEFEPSIQRVVKTRALSKTLGTGSPELAVSPKGDRIVAVGRSIARVPQLMLFDLEGKLLDLYSYTGREGSSPLLSYSSDGSILAVAYQKEITFFQMLAPGVGEKLVPDSNVVLAPSVVTAIAAHPHQGQFILGFEDGSIGLLSIEDKKLALFKGIVDQAVRSVAIDAERRQVYVGYQNGVLGVFALPAN